MAADLDGAVKWHTPIGHARELPRQRRLAGLYQGQPHHLSGSRRHGATASFVAAFDTRDRQTAAGGRHGRRQSAGARRLSIACRQKRRADRQQPATRLRLRSGDGKELWTVAGNTFEVIPTPVVGHDLVFCSSGRAGPTLAIRPGGSGNVTETHVAWSTPKGSPFVPSPFFVGDALYLVNDMQSIVTAYEAKTGALLFQGRLGERTARRFLRVSGRGERQGVLHERRWARRSCSRRA